MRRQAATTDGSGRYSIDAPGMGPYLIRVTHQGGSYFIAAPQGGAPGNVTVYDVAAKVDGVSIDADMFLLEAAGGMLRVHERFLVRNTSLPPRAQFSNNTFEIVFLRTLISMALPQRAPEDWPPTRIFSRSAKRDTTPSTSPFNRTRTKRKLYLKFNIISLTTANTPLSPQVQIPADNLVVYAARGIEFKAAPGSSFQSAQEDPRVQTFVAHNVHPGQKVAFSISGEGQMPSDAQNSAMAAQGGMSDSGGSSEGIGNGPGGGIGAPVGSPDPLTKYKWWILSLLALMLVAASGFLLRKRTEATAGGIAVIRDTEIEERIPAPARSVARVATAGSTVFTNTGTLERCAAESAQRGDVRHRTRKNCGFSAVRRVRRH